MTGEDLQSLRLPKLSVGLSKRLFEVLKMITEEDTRKSIRKWKYSNSD